MFLVEPRPGKQRAYPSMRELGAAIRRGELGADARIYHRATERWLPITAHPEFRRVAAEHEHRTRMELRARQWTSLTTDAPPVSEPQQPAAPTGPVLIPGTGAPSWLGATLRRLRSLTHI